MGLPSGIKWASCNVGANAPEKAGLFFSWGNTVGHRENSGYNFSQATYEASEAASIDSDLSLEHDMAQANLGQPWRLPTKTEFEELYNNCTIMWITFKGVTGLLFTSNVNDKSIFLPAAGSFHGTTNEQRGLDGFYWSSSYNSQLNAHDLYLSSSNVSPQDYSRRHLGFSVRAIQD